MQRLSKGKGAHAPRESDTFEYRELPVLAPIGTKPKCKHREPEISPIESRAIALDHEGVQVATRLMMRLAVRLREMMAPVD